MSVAETPPRLYCNYCQEELKSFSVKCCECSDTETFDLCLQCFRAGAEIGGHKRDHGYQIMDNALYPAGGRGEWSMTEESCLLEAIEIFGFGNWDGVGNHVVSKTKEECAEHYNTFYVQGNIGKVTLPENRVSKVIDHTGPEDGPLSPTLGATFKPVDLTVTEQQELCYMPLRDDFEREFDNDAETLISNLSITQEDDDLDISLKLAHVDMYSKRLKERGRRKSIARENGLITAAVSLPPSALPSPPQSSQKQKPQAVTKRKPSKEELEFREKLKPFARFLTSTNLEEMFDNIQKEKEVKSRIKELVRCRRNGITKLKEVEEYDEAKAKREKRKENKKKLAEKTKKGNIIAAAKKPDSKEDVKDEKLDIVEDEFHALRSSQGFSCLSEREKKLCSSLKMKPAKYVTMKTLIIKDHYLRKQGIPPKTRYPSNLDKSHRKRIANFLMRNGWIKAS
ncbi:transcriptional adapter 2-beta-like isoform X1 [Diadema antillarum]|uniref:transcriptional adapter 2-beta-like isoform X1 n=1 Tax=Diadema antillarum TaxID=105358 RepID=UPI003A83B218